MQQQHMSPGGMPGLMPLPFAGMQVGMLPVLACQCRVFWFFKQTVHIYKVLCQAHLSMIACDGAHCLNGLWRTRRVCCHPLACLRCNSQQQGA